MKFFGYMKDGGVIQRGSPVLVRGYAEGKVICTLAGGDYRETKTVVAENGRFAVVFGKVEDIRNVFVLTAECGTEKISAKVRFGDVYLALGQSNMSYCLSAVEEDREWRQRAEKVCVSFLSLEERSASEGGEITRPALPQEDLAFDYDWIQRGEKLASVSALCVQTATLLAERGGVPVGFVQTAMGGLSVETYMRRESVEEDPELVGFLKRAGKYVTIEDYNTVGGRNYTQFSGVWNEKIAPLVGLNFKGIVWYLGESSAYDFEFGRFFLREMKIICREYGQAFGEIPFVAVHIAPEYYPYGDKFGYLYINEALTQLQSECERVVSVPIYDIEPRWRKKDGDVYFHPIHPVNKAPVAERIADALDGSRIRYPEIAEVLYKKGEAICRIKHAGEGLAKGKLNGFTLAGKDGKYYPAQAEATNADEIRVTCRDVAYPERLTYAFMQYQDFCNAKSLDGAPLLPYRSESEAVSAHYCFPPAYTVNGALTVYENNFGWQAGTCRKAAVWKNGEIYDGAETEIRSEGERIAFTACPTAEEYFFFGISPALCLAGHKNHIADYKFWNFRLKAEGKVTFWGVVIRCSDGEIYRFDLRNGNKTSESVPLTSNFEEYAVDFRKGTKGDGSPVRFTRTLRKQIVEAEFLFRARERVTVYLKDLTLSDKNFSNGREEKEKERAAVRKDIKLPESFG